MTAKSRRFHLQRDVDETGMSGTGRVTEGVVLPNGVAVMWWLVPPHSVQIYKSITELEAIHSHGRGTTKVVYDDKKNCQQCSYCGGEMRPVTTPEGEEDRCIECGRW